MLNYIAAKNVTLPEGLRIKAKLKKDGRLTVKRSTPIVSLAPNDHFMISVEIVQGYESPEKAKENLEYQNTEESKGITFECPVDYLSELDSSKAYKTIAKFRIKKDRAQLLKSEMIEINTDTDETQGVKQNEGEP